MAAGSATFVGTALMNTILWELGDVNRVAAGVASGVGFLGAGLIAKREDRTDGLTTAAGIWLVAAIGFTVANGFWYIGLLVTCLALMIQFGALFFLAPRFYRDLWEKWHGTSYEEAIEAENNANVAQEAVASDEENADTQEQAEDSTEGAKKAS